MRYSNGKINQMIKDYLTEVADSGLWNQLEEGELDSIVNASRHTLIENYAASGTSAAADVLFLLTGEPKNYQAFTIEDGKLVALHQEHLAEYCLTCLEKEQTEQKTTAAQAF